MRDNSAILQCNRGSRVVLAALVTQWPGVDDQRFRTADRLTDFAVELAENGVAQFAAHGRKVARAVQRAPQNFLADMTARIA